MKRILNILLSFVLACLLLLTGGVYPIEQIIRIFARLFV